jgi:hypothetical protein
MKHIVNESSETIIASGQEGSYIRLKEQYNITFGKMFEVALLSSNFDEIKTKLFEIMKNSKLPLEYYKRMINAVLFYSKY